MENYKICLNSIVKYVLLFFVLNLVSSCFKTTKNIPSAQIELMNSASQIGFDSLGLFSNDSVRIYSILMDTSLSKRKILRLQLYSPIKFMNGQDLITYDYCDSKLECDTTKYENYKNGNREFTHDENTGQIKDTGSNWIHPPRIEYFKVLQMNAYPYFIDNEQEWNYDLNFGDHWGDKRWMTWKGRNIAYSKYQLKDTINYDLGNQKIECFEILATTKIEALGETETVFYYNEEFGFVYMLFKTINNKYIEFKMI